MKNNKRIDSVTITRTLEKLPDGSVNININFGETTLNAEEILGIFEKMKYFILTRQIILPEFNNNNIIDMSKGEYIG